MALGDHKAESETQENGHANGELSPTNFSVPPRERPMIHRATDAPLCERCRDLELTFFDPDCPGCQLLLQDMNLSVSQIFAIIRQWVPQVQRRIDILGEEVLRRGAHVNDRDGLTDMTLLQYACKAGATGIGSVEAASRLAELLISKGAEVRIRSRWTNMAALHYAAYFDVAVLISMLLKASGGRDVDNLCREYDNGTPLHIATTNLCFEAARCLLQHGADPTIKDGAGRTPLECIPDTSGLDATSETAIVATKMRILLKDAEPLTLQKNAPQYDMPSYETVSGKVLLSSRGLKLGERVIIGGVKMGTLRFCGTTEFASGVWAGIELDEPEGKNDGSIGGIYYFKCAPKHGIFAPLSKITKSNSPATTPRGSRPSTPQRRRLSAPKMDFSHVTARVETGLRKRSSSMTSEPGELEVGDRVIVAGQRTGVIRFSGKTDFAPGWWYGVELDKPRGKNDGSVSGVRYFSCEPMKGVFAPPSRVTRATPSRMGSMESLSSVGSDISSVHRTASSASYSGRSPRRDRVLLQRSAKATPFKRSLSGSGPVDFALTEGMTVLVSNINELGTIRYIGPADFAEGVWLGVELRAPKGKNDGSVKGTRYFSCRPSHGLLVRPSRVTCRGINGTKLLGGRDQKGFGPGVRADRSSVDMSSSFIQ
ncbi:CAP-Gly domain-containing linker protein 3-like [Branchiostoma floridae]|uniref:CAP-Gly domain-containing linker protein 3-like n=2 Tax=Branchiostoma floridae TaxID=7739 RepID=A0A9J7MFT5_BRAFL|nr:CAP-Gly domain-containing linker protein 3-like [Branchiostoma floridae]